MIKSRDFRPKHTPGVKACAFEKSPCYEIILYRTKLRFRNPKSTYKIPKDLTGKRIDQRPFLNNVSKQKYHCDEELGRCITNIYQSIWSMYPRRLFSSIHAALDFRLYGLGVTVQDRPLYTDLYEYGDGKRWILNYYSSNIRDFNEFSIHTANISTDEKRVVAEQQNQDDINPYDFKIEALTVNGHIAYRSRPFPEQIDYFFPFSKIDLLQFSFRLQQKRKLSEAQREMFLKVVSQFANALVNTVEFLEESR